MKSDPFIRLENVKKTYDVSGTGSALSILQGISLDVDTGERIAVVGPSGSGKSTLLNLIGALDRPTEGRVLLEGVDLAQASDRELSTTRNKKIGFVFQDHHLLPQCTVLENVLIPVLAASRTAATHVDQARDLLKQVGLSERLNHRPTQLSGGECQRVAVVRALINGPVLLLADEPTGSLDATSAVALSELLVELNGELGLTMIVVTHSLALARRMNRTYVLRNGLLEA